MAGHARSTRLMAAAPQAGQKNRPPPLLGRRAWAHFFTNLYYIPQGEVGNQDKSSFQDNLLPDRNWEAAPVLPERIFAGAPPKTLSDRNRTPQGNLYGK